jgi:hypothetical protein
MSKGLYLMIGLNSLDPEKYNGEAGKLNACENDARDLAEIAKANNFSGKTLLTREASSSSVLAELHAAARALESGDMLVVGYSGHGGQVGDVTGEEVDGLDETWCLYDRMLVDDELYAMWAKFKPGVRILVLSDSCHSGTVTKQLEFNVVSEVLGHAPELASLRGQWGFAGGTSLPRAKALPFEKSWEIYLGNKELYDSAQYVAGTKGDADIKASVILISGCQDNQFSRDGEHNSAFTKALIAVWNGGKFGQNYGSFRKSIADQLPSSQSPNYFVIGQPNLGYEAQRPFQL